MPTKHGTWAVTLPEHRGLLLAPVAVDGPLEQARGGADLHVLFGDFLDFGQGALSRPLSDRGGVAATDGLELLPCFTKPVPRLHLALTEFVHLVS